jgi:hypothetical protein
VHVGSASEKPKRKKHALGNAKCQYGTFHCSVIISNVGKIRLKFLALSILNIAKNDKFPPGIPS